MNRSEVSKVLEMLRSEWRDAQIDNARISLWVWAFEDVPYELAADAVKRWMKTGKFFPRPAELLELIGVRLVAPELVPEAAWTEVLAEVRRVGFNRLPTFRNGAFEDPLQRSFSSPLIDQAVDAVGWETICTSDKPEVVRSQFVKALDALVKRAVRDVQVGDVVSVDGPALPDVGTPALKAVS